VAEFNTYDILCQRYLVLTREALAKLKERAKEKVARRPERVDSPEQAGKIQKRNLSRNNRARRARAAATAGSS
jgi:hypothetical protein